MVTRDKLFWLLVIIPFMIIGKIVYDEIKERAHLKYIEEHCVIFKDADGHNFGCWKKDK